MRNVLTNLMTSVGVSAIVVGNPVVNVFDPALQQVINMTIDSSQNNIAPMRVHFRPNLNSASFDNTSTYDAIEGVTYSNGYSPEQHNIDVYVFTGDSGTYDKVNRVPNTSNTKSVLLGWDTQHVYSEVGEYEPVMVLYEPSSGKWGITDGVGHTQSVLDPSSLYTTARTVLINPDGDNDFSWGDGYVGAQTVNAGAGNSISRTDTWWAGQWSGPGYHRRYVFKNGATYSGSLRWDSDPASCMITCDGPGSRAILSTTYRLFEPFNLTTNAPAMVDIRICGFDCTGGYDPATTGANTTNTTRFLGSLGSLVDCVVEDVNISGFGGYTIGQFGSGALDYRFALSNSSMDNFGGQYGLIMGASGGAGSDDLNIISVVGTRSYASPLANAYDGEIRANFRFNAVRSVYMAYCDMFGSTTGGQPLVKMIDKGITSYAPNASVHDCVGEGNWGFMGVNMNSSGASGQINNVVVQGIRYIAGPHSRFGIRSSGFGLTLRGCAFFLPNIGTTDQWRGWVWLSRDGDLASYPQTSTAPTRVYGNNFINTRDDSNNGTENYLNTSPDTAYAANGAFPDVYEEDNVNHVPNVASPVDGQVDTADSGITMLNVGVVNSSYVIDASYASTGVAYFGVPSAGSSNIGSRVSEFPLARSLSADLGAVTSTDLGATMSNKGAF